MNYSGTTFTSYSNEIDHTESFLTDCPKLTKVEFVPELINHIDLSVIEQFVDCKIGADYTKRWTLKNILNMPNVQKLEIASAIDFVDSNTNYINCITKEAAQLNLIIASKHIPYLTTQGNLGIRDLKLNIVNEDSVIPAQSFKNCNYLNNLQISDSESTFESTRVAIEREAFWNCFQSKGSIEFSDTLEISKIEPLAFYGWNADMIHAAEFNTITYSYVGTIDSDDPDTKANPKIIMQITDTEEVADEATRPLGPEFFVDKNVLALYPGAAQGCLNISNLDFSESKVLFIADSCFEDCARLVTINLNGILRLERDSFKNCLALITVEAVSADLQYFDLTTFEGCLNLIYHTNEENGLLKFLTSDAECPILAGYDADLAADFAKGDDPLEIPDYVKVILPEALKDFPGQITFAAENDNFPEDDADFPSDNTNLTVIGDRAFYNCPNLTSIKIPKTMSYLGREMFLGCKNLFKIFIPKTITTIEANAFKELSSNNSLLLKQ
jgi:hypothetical protein